MRWTRAHRFDAGCLPIEDQHYNRRKVGSPVSPADLCIEGTMSKRSKGHLRHVRVCVCGRKIQGNGFWRHRQACAIAIEADRQWHLAREDNRQTSISVERATS
jgi:hypothetical protein